MVILLLTVVVVVVVVVVVEESGGTALQTGRSRDQFPIASLEFFIDIILPAALWLWDRLSL
jgi:hypothetical protein